MLMRRYTATGCIVGIVLFALILGAVFLLFTSVIPAEEARPPAETAPREHEPETSAPPEEQEPEVEGAWPPPRFEERAEERTRMVRRQIEDRGVRDEDVLEAMHNAPRHLFVPEGRRANAYADHPLPIGYGQTISQPYIVAYMTEKLELEEGDRVLEVGTGSGYQAAVLAEITPHVYTIEIIGELARQARRQLHRLGYETVRVKHADGYFGWEEHGPFDGIIVTAAAGHPPPPLVNQLKPGGRMIIPVGGPYTTQQLVLLTKDAQGEASTRSLMPVRFVPFTRDVRAE